MTHEMFPSPEFACENRMFKCTREVLFWNSLSNDATFFEFLIIGSYKPPPMDGHYTEGRRKHFMEIEIKEAHEDKKWYV
jgi:hypothetical protein